MFQNIKVDIIYYKTNTDFEMEFNLCGCCRMRLLTDKSPDSKTMVHSLARAVSRSRVIIITGSLFGEDGIIKLAAEAIKSELSPTDLKTYGISSDEEIEIIKGATPLVTPEGYFGGCIIERGPQTMILLSDSKSIRKTIMQTLIHPYIEELCATELKEMANAANTTAPIIAETDEEEEVIQEEPEVEEVESQIIFEPQEVIEDDTSVDNDNDFQILMEDDEYEYEEELVTLSNGMVFETEDEVFEPAPKDIDSDLFVESNQMHSRESDKYNTAYVDYDYDDDGIVADEDFKQSKPFTHRPLNITLSLITGLILVLIAVLCYCLVYLPAKYGYPASAYINEIINAMFL